MSLIAAFLWNKSPRCSISTMIFDEETIQLLSAPTIHYFAKSYFRFRRDVKLVIKHFFAEIKRLQQRHKKPITLEFKIVFHAHDIPYLKPAKESKFVYDLFLKYYKKTKRKLKSIDINPQLRKRLTGRHLIQFKKELRSLYLVSRKRHTGFEYHLWTVALHATPATYAAKLNKIRTKLVNAVWDSAA